MSLLSARARTDSSSLARLEADELNESIACFASSRVDFLENQRMRDEDRQGFW